MYDHFIALDWAQNNMAISRMTRGSDQMKTVNVPSSIKELQLYLSRLKGKKIMLDKDLAALYGVETEHLKRQVRRNMERFPGDFLLILSRQEVINLIHHFGGSSWGGTRKEEKDKKSCYGLLQRIPSCRLLVSSATPTCNSSFW